MKAILDGGCEVILFCQSKLGREITDHETAFPFMIGLPGLTVLDHSAQMDLHFDVLFVTWSHSIRFSSEQKRILRKRVEQARRVMLLYDAQFGTPRQVFLQEVRALISEFGWLRRVRDVCYMLVFPRFDLLSVFFRRRFPLSVGPNIHFICDGTDREKLFADWNPSLKRKFAVFASGAKTSSAWRVELIGFLEDQLRSTAAGQMVESLDGNGGDSAPQIVWSFGGSRLSLDKYLEMLTESDFTLCIPGTSWTHRPIESLVRGSIPILDAENMRMHDIPWKDGANCLVVRKPRDKECWLAAILRALSLPDEVVLEMRHQIRSLRRDFLLPEAASKRLRNKMRINDHTPSRTNS